MSGSFHFPQPSFSSDMCSVQFRNMLSPGFGFGFGWVRDVDWDQLWLRISLRLINNYIFLKHAVMIIMQDNLTAIDHFLFSIQNRNDFSDLKCAIMIIMQANVTAIAHCLVSRQMWMITVTSNLQSGSLCCNLEICTSDCLNFATAIL